LRYVKRQREDFFQHVNNAELFASPLFRKQPRAVQLLITGNRIQLDSRIIGSEEVDTLEKWMSDRQANGHAIDSPPEKLHEAEMLRRGRGTILMQAGSPPGLRSLMTEPSHREAAIRIEIPRRSVPNLQL
jgi:hypothetical protein